MLIYYSEDISNSVLLVIRYDEWIFVCFKRKANYEKVWLWFQIKENVYKFGVDGSFLK